MPVTTNTRKLAALLGASGAGIGTDGLLQAAAVDANVATQAELDASVYSDVAVRQDITTLALRQAIGDNHVAYNLPNSFIDQFEDDSKIGTETNTNRSISGEYVASASTISTVKLNDLGGLYIDAEILLPLFSHTWTAEVWVYLTGSWTDHENMVFSNGEDGYAIVWGINGGTAQTRRGLGNGSWTASGNLGSANDVTTQTWQHYAICKTPSGVSFFFNGSRKEDGNSNAYTWNNNQLMLGQGVSASSHNLEGYVTEWRISDLQRYTSSSYTIPTTEFVDDDNTLLLMHSNTTDGSKVYTDVSSHTNKIISNNSSIEHSDDVASPFSITASATGTVIGTANVPSSAQTKVSGVMLYKDAYGTATLGTDLEIYFTCNGGTNWTEAASYTAVTPVFSTGIKMVKLGETTCTSGSDVRYKAVWANQSAKAKETQLHGIGLNY